MTLPSGISTATLTVGNAYDFHGTDAQITVKITPILGGLANHIVWEATGGLLANFVGTYKAEGGDLVEFEVPHVDQEGFVDGSGDAFTLWYYKAQVTLTIGRQTVQYEQNFQVFEGQATVDLDLVPSTAPGEPTVIVAPAVLSVNGETGNVTVEGGGGGAVDSVNGQVAVVVLDQDDVADGTTAKQYTATEKAKLAGIATGATANQSDATTNAAIAAKADAAATTAALALKAPLASPQFTGIPRLPAVQYGLQAVSASTVLTLASPYYTRVTVGGSSKTVTLPDTTTEGIVFLIAKADTGTFPVTVTPSVSIEGVASITLSDGEWIEAMSTTVSGVWRIIERSAPAIPNQSVPYRSGAGIGVPDSNLGVGGTSGLVKYDGTGGVVVATPSVGGQAANKTYVDAAAAAAISSVGIVANSGTTKTLALTDAGKVISSNSGSPTTVTVPTNATVAFPIGSVVQVLQYGAGQVTIAPAAGVTLRYASSLTSRAQYSVLTLHKLGTNEWLVGGDAT